MDGAGGAREERSAEGKEKSAGEHFGGLAAGHNRGSTGCVVQDLDGLVRMLENVA